MSLGVALMLLAMLVSWVMTLLDCEPEFTFAVAMSLWTAGFIATFAQTS